MALNSVGEALREISLAGAPAAEDRLSPLTEVLGVELLQHLDAVSLCRLSLCARLFSKEDSTTPGRRIVLEFPGNSPRLYSVRPPAPRRSICEDVARERALDLMDEHVAGLCALEGVSSVRELGHNIFLAFLSAFYECLATEGHRRFPYLPDGRTLRPKSRWPKGRRAFQGWFHTLDAFEAGPVAAYAAACAVFYLAQACVDLGQYERTNPANAVLSAAHEAADRALLARPGKFEVLVATRQFLSFRPDELAAHDERIAALVTNNGGSRWERSTERGGAPDTCGIATFPSVRHAVDAKDALRADEAVEGLSAGSDWEHLLR